MACTSDQLPIVFSPVYDISFCGLERLHPFDAGKWGRIHRFLVDEQILTEEQFVRPLEAQNDDLRVVHSDAYLNSLKVIFSHCNSIFSVLLQRRAHHGGRPGRLHPQFHPAADCAQQVPLPRRRDDYGESYGINCYFSRAASWRCRTGGRSTWAAASTTARPRRAAGSAPMPTSPWPFDSYFCVNESRRP